MKCKMGSKVTVVACVKHLNILGGRLLNSVALNITT